MKTQINFTFEVEFDEKKPKRCKCGVLIYLAKVLASGKIVKIHRTANGYAHHVPPYCDIKNEE